MPPQNESAVWLNKGLDFRLFPCPHVLVCYAKHCFRLQDSLHTFPHNNEYLLPKVILDVAVQLAQIRTRLGQSIQNSVQAGHGLRGRQTAAVAQLPKVRLGARVDPLHHLECAFFPRVVGVTRWRGRATDVKETAHAFLAVWRPQHSVRLAVVVETLLNALAMNQFKGKGQAGASDRTVSLCVIIGERLGRSSKQHLDVVYFV